MLNEDGHEFDHDLVCRNCGLSILEIDKANCRLSIGQPRSEVFEYKRIRASCKAFQIAIKKKELENTLKIRRLIKRV